jgi:hypothetical protein
MLPPGTIAALKGRPNEIVVVSVATVAFGALAAGAPAWPAVAIAAIALFAYHLRSTATERYMHAMAQLKVDEAVAAAEMVKARHRDQLAKGQENLQLERPPRRLTSRRPDDKGGSR